MKTNLLKIKSLIVANVLLPLLSFAQNVPFLEGFYRPGLTVRGRGGVGQVSGLCDIVRILNTFITWAQVVLFSLAVIMALYAAFLFITGKGENFKDAKNVLIYAAVGVGVALLAYSVVPLVVNFLDFPYYERCPNL